MDIIYFYELSFDIHLSNDENIIMNINAVADPEKNLGMVPNEVWSKMCNLYPYQLFPVPK